MLLLKTKGLPQQADPLCRNSGFGLLEMLVVMGLIAIIFTFAMPSISSSFQISINSAAREISSVVTEAYNASIMTGKVYRVAYDLKEGTYWAEAGTPGALLDTKESLEREEQRKKFLNIKEEKKSAFSQDNSITRKKKTLPIGVKFEDVVSQQSPDPITEGMAYTHFFPHGLTEQTIVHLKDTSKHHVSLVMTSMIGQTDVYDRYVDKKEAFGE